MPFTGSQNLRNHTDMGISEKDKKEGPVVVVAPVSSLSTHNTPSSTDVDSLDQSFPEVVVTVKTIGTIDIGDDNTDYPDGGVQAWLQVLAGHLANAIACGYPATFGIFQLYYTATLGMPAAQVSWIGSVQVFLTNATCVVGGRLTDAGYGRHAVLVGSLLMVFGAFMTSLAVEYWQIFLAQGICSGLGLGLIWMPAMAIVSSYFKQRRSLALNIASAGTGTGSLVFPATVQYLIPKVGFGWAVRASGFVALIIVVAMNLLLRPRLAPRKGGPILEVKAFKEVPFALFTVGTFLVYFALYVGTFYVSHHRPVVSFHPKYKRASHLYYTVSTIATIIIPAATIYSPFFPVRTYTNPPYSSTPLHSPFLVKSSPRPRPST
jgi:MFS family permease